ncbi:MAG: LLM class flavin-dependent oxidoreductase [Acidimicrobiales bacterium]
MRLGVVILPEYRWEEAAGLWRDAEALGFHHAWTYDHLAWRNLRDSPWFGAVPVLAAAATVTSRIRLGPLVSSPNFRHPVAFAREVLALDDVASGRLNLGIGAGGRGWDSTILGQEPWTGSERTERFSEFVHLLDKLLTSRETTYSGRYYSATEARSHPGCRQSPRVPFVLAGSGPRAMDVVAQWGQTWVTTGPLDAGGSVATADGVSAVRAQVAMLEAACEKLSRDPHGLDRMVLAGPVLDQALTSVQEFVDTLGAYGDVGITDFVVHWPRDDEPYSGDRTRFESVITEVLGS